MRDRTLLLAKMAAIKDKNSHTGKMDSRFERQMTLIPAVNFGRYERQKSLTGQNVRYKDQTHKGPQRLRALRRHLVLSPVAKGPGIKSRGAVIVAMQWCKVHGTVSTDGSLPEPTKN